MNKVSDNVLEGKSIRDAIRIILTEKVKKIVDDGGSVPTLAIFHVEDGTTDSATAVYIKMKKNFGESIGAQVIHKRFKQSTTEEELKREVEMINRDHLVHGLIVQLPLPSHINKFEIIEAINPMKDADGLHSKSRVFKFLPATTRGIITLLDHYGIKIKGTNFLVIGHSYLVGIPTAIALLERDATVTVAHKETRNTKELCLNSDVIISATGCAGLITKDFIKPEHIIVDVGINNVGGEIVGDVAYDEVAPIVKGITPVPGGIGPLTVASLFENLLDLYEKKSKI